MPSLYSAVLSSDGLFSDLIDLRGLYGAGGMRLTVDRGSVRLSAGAAPETLDIVGDYGVGVYEVGLPLVRWAKVERLTGNSSTILVEVLSHAADELNVTAKSNPLTGRVRISAGNVDWIVDSRPLYPSYFQKRPLQHIVVPFGTAAINESILTGGTVSRSVDTSVLFNGQPSSRFQVTGSGSSPNLEVGVTSAAINLDAEAQSLTARTPLCAVKVSGSGVLTGATLYVGGATYSNFHTFGVSQVATKDGWIILSKSSFGATSTTGTPNLTTAVRAKLRLTFAANVAVGDVWVSPFYALPQPKPSVVFTCDDGYSEGAWLAAEAAKRGVPVSFGVARDYIGQSGFLTESELLNIANGYDNLHEITNHARVNSNYVTLGLAEYVAHVEACRDYLVGLGLSRKAASMHQYVQGQFDQALIDELKTRGYLSCREVGASNRASANAAIALEGVGSNALFKLPATCLLENTQNLSTVQGCISSAAQAGTAFILGHRFAATAGSVQWIKGYDASYGVLNLLDWLAEQRDTNGWQLRRWSDWYSDQTNTKCNALL